MSEDQSMPLVSILCPAYNHELYIKDALDGFIKQKTNFKFEIIVHDDASTDGTKLILSEYEQKYPHLFRNIYQTENQFSKNYTNVVNTLLASAKGKYIALCEGDDYWCEPNKLQEQVDFLERNHECVYVFTNRQILSREGKLANYMPLNFPDLFDLDYLLSANIVPGTQTVMFKNIFSKEQIPEQFSTSFNGDWVLLFLVCQSGLIGFIPKVTAVYRESIGMISSTNKLYKFINGLETNKKLNQITNYKFTSHIGNYYYHYSNMAYCYLENKQRFKGFYWIFKTVLYKFRREGMKSLFSNDLQLFLKHSLNLLFKK